MENFCKGLGLGFAAGLILGGVMVAKNKKLQNKIKACMSGASEKFEEAKTMLEDKIDDVQQKLEDVQTKIESVSLDENLKLNKKSKKG